MATKAALERLTENLNTKIENQSAAILGVSRVLVAGEVVKRGAVVKLSEDQIASRRKHLKQTLSHQVELRKEKDRILTELA